ncbi:MAG: hypothetical protein P8N06_02145 [Methylophilaceae bacterium]|nr:hypothetical protein [Methylophilaceae bacterium]
MKNYFEENDRIAQYYIDNPNSLTKEILLKTTGEPHYDDKAVYWLKSFFFKTKPKDAKDNNIRKIGNFEITREWEPGIRSNSGKSSHSSQTCFEVLDLTNGEKFSVGQIYYQENRRSRGGKLE